MKRYQLLTATVLLASVAAAPLRAQSVLPLYAGRIPNSSASKLRETSTLRPDGSTRITDVVVPTLIVFRPAAGAGTGAAVIICPGGSYARLAIDQEGYEVARLVAGWGLTAFVLKYRLPNEESQPDKTTAPLLDAQQALRLVRRQAARYHLDPARIGLLGFSAGGHLAATVATRAAQLSGARPDSAAVRPAFLALLYPVISFQDSLTHLGSRRNLLGPALSAEQVRAYSNELQLTAWFPPTFLVHAQDDRAVPVQGSLAFYLACLRRHVPVELHLYPEGGHGFGLHNPATPDQWADRFRNWLIANGWLAH